MEYNFDFLVFDWDGTLFDSTPSIVRAIQSAAKDQELPVPDFHQAAYVIGMTLSDAMQHIFGATLPKVKYEALIESYSVHYAQNQQHLSLFEGILPMLHRLQNLGFRMAIATGKSRMGLDEALVHTDVQGLFVDSRTADETAGKPNPQMLYELMEANSACPNQTLVIGDTTYDLAMAANANCASVGVSYGAHPDDDFKTYNPIAILHSVAELDRFLSNLK